MVAFTLVVLLRCNFKEVSVVLVDKPPTKNHRSEAKRNSRVPKITISTVCNALNLNNEWRRRNLQNRRLALT